MPTKLGNITAYKIEEVIEAFKEGGGKVTKQTIQRYIRENKLKGQKAGGIWWVTEDSLRDWLSGRLAKPLDDQGPKIAPKGKTP